ncbi:Exonuclease SbcC [Actinacidiphila cocklensis]|uniref:Exonuclease SbcC n=1 Tax=Actinacidiphila cocklensis TaxID=887465 RepID=A0A9W4E7U1_9ACTN|nr:Exonuclease SbcC [Actinacidiphila cocklensis]
MTTHKHRPECTFVDTCASGARDTQPGRTRTAPGRKARAARPGHRPRRHRPVIAGAYRRRTKGPIPHGATRTGHPRR